MCGRYFLQHSPKAIRDGLDALSGDNWDWRISEFPTLGCFNMAPGQSHPVACVVNGETVIVNRDWGLVPAWMKDPSKAQINARAETVWEKPMFRDAVRKGRCLVPASGWYEWQQGERGKQPHALAPMEDTVLLFAGIEENGTFAILTRDASPALAHIYPRMPCVLSAEAAAAWLGADDEAAAAALKQRVQGTFKAWPVAARVNNPRNDDPQNLDPADDPTGNPA